MEVATRRREQEVWQACDDLWALFGDMRHITGDGIRERLLSLGKSRGSPNEIYKYRKSWFHSRGIASATAGHDHDTAENDPISRAVRLVHEQLKDDTEHRIDALKLTFAEQLTEKDHALDKSKAALDKVLIEFGVLEQKLSTTTLDVKNLTYQLAAEIDVRRALEKELQVQKTLYQNDKHHHTVHVEALQKTHADELVRLKCYHDENTQTYKAQLTELTERLQNLGHDYSDQLMAVKTALLNQEIITSQFENKLTLALENLRLKERELRTMHDNLMQEQALVSQHAATLRMRDDEIVARKTSTHTLHEQLTENARRHKKAEISIARLRAYTAHSHGAGHGLP